MSASVMTKKCIVCGKNGFVEVVWDEWDAYQKGILIQEAMPSADANTREQIISGTHPECWIKLFPKEED